MTRKKPANPKHPNLRPDDDPGATRLKFTATGSAPGLDNEFDFCCTDNPQDAVGWIAKRELAGYELIAILPGGWSGGGVWGGIGVTMFFSRPLSK